MSKSHRVSGNMIVVSIRFCDLSYQIQNFLHMTTMLVRGALGLNTRTKRGKKDEELFVPVKIQM